MRLIVKAASLSFACVLAIGALMPGNAAAARWKVSGTILEKSTETALIGDEAGKLTIIAVHLTEVTCGVEYLKRLRGGNPGTGEFTFLQPYGCTDNTSGCTVSEAKAERLNYPTELSEAAGKFLDLVKGIAIAFKLAGSGCSIAGSYVLEEEAQGEFENLTHTLVFPTTSLPGTFLVINDLTTLHGYGGRLEGSLPLPSVEVVK